MRLGALTIRANSIDELEPLCEKCDALGLSAIPAPAGYTKWTDDACAAYGEKATSLGFVIGEAGFWQNFLDPDSEAVKNRIKEIRQCLQKGDIMGLRCVVSLAGSKAPGNKALLPHPYNYTDKAKAECREIFLRIVDGLDLNTTRYAIEPWCNGFFYLPDDINAFLKSVNDPRIGLHLDMMNMVSLQTYFHTTELINHTFDLLGDRIVSVHAKDIRWDVSHLMLKWDEVCAGEGVLDYDTFLSNLDKLDRDMTVYTEHWFTEEQWLKAIHCLHDAAAKTGVSFLKRNE